MKNLRICAVTAALCVIVSMLSAQPQSGNGYGKETDSLEHIDFPYRDGKLSFDYYYEGDVKIPHGKMSFENKYYTEIGEMRNGLREGLWTIRQSRKSNPATHCFTYRNGLLEGLATVTCPTIEGIATDTLQFRQGHLIGENVLHGSSESLRLCTTQDGYRCGTWEIVFADGDKEVIIYDNEGNVAEMYQLDVLGQKSESYGANIHAEMMIIQAKQRMLEQPGAFPRKERVKLPSLSEHEFGLTEMTLSNKQ